MADAASRSWPHRRRPSRPWPGLAALGLVVAACAAEQVEPTVHIAKDRADPPLFAEVAFDPALQPGLDFSLAQAVTASGTPRFFWYYDFDPANAELLDAYAVCGDRPQCKLLVCTARNAAGKQHKLLAVVSSHPLVAAPQGPFDFPEGAAFDAVEWHIEVGPNGCPAKR